MQYDSLSQNGIEKVISNAPSIVQILDLQSKEKDQSKFYIVEISDGFAKLRRSVIMQDVELKSFDVIRTEQVTPNFKDGKQIQVLIEKYSLIRNDITSLIGNPIYFQDWQKSRSNPQGDNTLPPRKVGMKPNTNPNPKVPLQMNKKPLQTNNNSFAPQPKPLNNQPPQKTTFQPQQNNISSGNNSNTTSFNFPSRNPPPQPQKQVQNLQKPPLNLPQQNQPKQTMPQQSNKNQNETPNNRHDKNYTFLSELYEGIDDWKIKVRVLFRTEVKSYVKKSNGQQSYVFSFEACDHIDCIQISAFGDTAGNFGNVIDVDKVYEISGGKVGKDDQKNKLKIMLTEKSVISLLDEDLTLLTAEDVCISPEKLLQKESGSQWNVIALVKDINPVQEFISKNGKKCKKKEIFLCDPEAEIEVPMTLWFEKADLTFEKVPYAFQGITVGQFKDQKQFSTSLKFSCRPYKTHSYRKFVSTYEKMKLENPVYEIANRSRTNIEIFNFLMLKQEAEKLDNFNTLTVEKLCYLTQISSGTKNYYLSCPVCKKKVLDEQNGVCLSQKCGKSYQRGKYRYLLNVSLTDEMETIWATAYDEAAEVLLTSDIDNNVLTADQFAKMSEDDFKLLMPHYLDRQVKVTISAKKDTYNGNERVKYAVNKAVLHIDYPQEAAMLTKQLELLKSSMN